MERLEDIPSLPGQPTLTLDELANATKVKRKKIVAAANPVFAKVPAAAKNMVYQRENRQLQEISPRLSMVIRLER
jgi:hypothetical protein